MLKENKRYIFLTSLITALPIPMGLLLWDRLPDKIATHFNFAGVADGWSSKPFAVIGLPCFLVGIHLLCTLMTAADPRSRNISGKLFRLVLWICPITSLLVNSAVYLYALEVPVDISLLSGVFTGVLFLIVGNYLPKCRQNYTVGIKLPWTLADEDNWNRTHRMAGPLWMAAGILFFLLSVTGYMGPLPLLLLITAAVVIPTIYSYRLFSRKKSSSR